MNSTTRPSLLLSATLLLSISALFAVPATAQKLDAPDTIQSFPVGNGPIGLASEGDNIWATIAFDNTVTKLRASDGALLGTFPVGTYPSGILFDGTSIWVVNFYDYTVT